MFIFSASFISDPNLKDSMEGNLSGRICYECGKIFPAPSKLERHRVVHSGLKPYICQFCDRAYTQKSHMKRHELRHMWELKNEKISDT